MRWTPRKRRTGYERSTATAIFDACVRQRPRGKSNGSSCASGTTRLEATKAFYLITRTKPESIMTSHAFDAWRDGNDEAPGAGWPVSDREAAVNTLRDILALTEENLPPLTVAARVQQITRAALERLGALPAITDANDADVVAFIDERQIDGEPPF
jgi:hypothetical protein